MPQQTLRTKRREVILAVSGGVTALSGCLSSSPSPEEEVAEVIDGNYDYARHALTNGFDDYEAEAYYPARNQADLAYDSFSEPLTEAQNGARTSDGRKEELYTLAEEHLRLARGASYSLLQAADEQIKNNENLAQEHYSEAHNRWEQSANLAGQLRNELEGR